MTIQQLKLRLAPVLLDDQGEVLAAAEQLISDSDVLTGAGTSAEPAHERE